MIFLFSCKFLVKYEWNTSWFYFDFFLICKYPLFSIGGTNLHITLQTFTERESKYELNNYKHNFTHSERSVLSRAMDSIALLETDTISHLLMYYFSKLIGFKPSLLFPEEECKLTAAYFAFCWIVFSLFLLKLLLSISSSGTYTCLCVLSRFSCIWLCVTLWTVACQSLFLFGG